MQISFIIYVSESNHYPHDEETNPRLEQVDRIIARTLNIDQRLGITIRSVQEEYAHHATNYHAPHRNSPIDARDLGTFRSKKGFRKPSV